MSKRIVVVEDDQMALKSLVELLTASGYEVWGFENAESVKREAPADVDTALIDVQLPGELGTDLAKELKEGHPTMKVILMTGKKINPEALTPGTTLFFKPINCDKLLKTLSGARSPVPNTFTEQA